MSPSLPLHTYKRALRWAIFITFLALLPFAVTSQLNPFASAAAQSSSIIQFDSSNYSVNENAGKAIFTVTRSGDLGTAVTAKVTLTDVTTNPKDYRFNPGALDQTFNPPNAFYGSFYNNSLTLQADGKVLISNATGIKRLNTDGSIDTSFGNGLNLNAGVQASAVQPDGKIIIVGGFTTANYIRRNGIARLNNDGSLDTTFDIGMGTESGGYFNVVTVQPDGKVIVAGNFRTINGTQVPDVARLNTDGSLDNTFVHSTSPASTTYALAVQADGKVLVGGLGYEGLARLNPDGTTDTGFKFAPGSQPILTVAVQPNGKIVIGGRFNSVNGTTAYNVARLNPDGSLDTSFNSGSGPDGALNAVVAQLDGKVVIGGGFNSVNGVARKNIARLNNDGNLDSTFNSGSGTDSAVYAMVAQSDGKVIIGGFFNSVDGISRPGIARLNGDLFVIWAAGDGSNKTITLPIVDDLIANQNKTLKLTLTPLTGGATTGANATATLTIVNTDAPPTFTGDAPPAVINMNAAFNYTFTATGSPAPTFKVTTGTLPPGLVLSPNGVLSGTPYSSGTYSNITVTASNGVTPDASQTFSIKVNSLPQANGNSYFTYQDKPLTVAAPGVLNNVYNADNDPLTAVLVSPPSHGTLNLNADGSFIYTPAAGYVGSDKFTYRVSDGYGSSDLTTASINVNPLPKISINDVSISEGNFGTKVCTFGVTLSSSINQVVTVTYATADGTATAGSDYVAASGTLTFNPNEFSKAIAIQVIGDTVNEPDETFFVNLSNPTNATLNKAQGIGTILNDDAPLIQFSAQSYVVSEGAGSAIITVNRYGDVSGVATVDYITGDNSAKQSKDYTLASGTLSFASGETSKTFTVLIADNAYVDGNRTVGLFLRNAKGASVPNPYPATLTITDNDVAAATTNPIDDTHYFVRQQYLDFLSREADAGGLDYWKGLITSCNPTDQQCINSKRVTVSAAFFIEQEFQLTGNYVYRMYTAAYGQRPAYTQFMPDRARINPDANQIEASKQQFADLFVQRSQFLAKYPANITPDAFVDGLIATVKTETNGVVDLTSQRTTLLSTLQTSGRGSVVRQVAETTAFQSAEYNKAFVMMQYFGYLRRDPEDGGYNFWLDVLNNRVANNYRGMVCAFITSAEYQDRFSSVRTRNDSICGSIGP